MSVPATAHLIEISREISRCASEMTTQEIALSWIIGGGVGVLVAFVAVLTLFRLRFIPNLGGE